MKRLLSSKVLIMVLCVFVLVGSVALYSASNEEIIDKCNEFCDDQFDEVKMWMACIAGCLYGASL